MNPQVPSGMDRQIGPTLRDARRRLGMEVREVEERTKIRARYIRALENEDWEALPAPAYVRGFLRTYGQMLGLDGEMLADEFRRRSVGVEATSSPPTGEPVLTGRRRPGERPPTRGPIIAAVALGLLGVVLLLGLFGGGDGDEPGPEDPLQTREMRRDQQRQVEKATERRTAPLRQVEIDLEALSTVTVCLVADREALIDGQVLSEGAEENYGGSKSYRLDLVGGALRVAIAGEQETVRADGDGASVEADSRGIRATEYEGPGCP